MEEEYYKFRRMELMREKGIPTQSEVREHLGSALTEIFFNSIDEDCEILLGRAPVMEGITPPMFISPSDIMIGKQYLKPPLTSRVLKAQTHEGILEIGEECITKLRNELRAEVIKAINDMMQVMRNEISNEMAKLQHDLEEKERLRCHSEKMLMVTTFRHDFQVLKEQYDQWEESRIAALIQKERNEVQEFMDDQLSSALITKAESCSAECQREIKDALNLQQCEFLKVLNLFFDEAVSVLKCMEAEHAYAMTNMRAKYESVSMSDAARTVRDERERCEQALEKERKKCQAVAGKLRAELQQKEAEMKALKESLEGPGKVSDNQLLCHVLKEFQRYVDYALRTRPQRADYLLSLEKLKELHDMVPCAGAAPPTEVTMALPQFVSVPESERLVQDILQEVMDKVTDEPVELPCDSEEDEEEEFEEEEKEEAGEWEKEKMKEEEEGEVEGEKEEKSHYDDKEEEWFGMGDKDVLDVEIEDWLEQLIPPVPPTEETSDVDGGVEAWAKPRPLKDLVCTCPVDLPCTCTVCHVGPQDQADGLRARLQRQPGVVDPTKPQALPLGFVIPRGPGAVSWGWPPKIDVKYGIPGVPLPSEEPEMPASTDLFSVCLAPAKPESSTESEYSDKLKLPKKKKKIPTEERYRGVIRPSLKRPFGMPPVGTRIGQHHFKQEGHLIPLNMVLMAALAEGKESAPCTEALKTPHPFEDILRRMSERNRLHCTHKDLCIIENLLAEKTIDEPDEYFDLIGDEGFSEEPSLTTLAEMEMLSLPDLPCKLPTPPETERPSAIARAIAEDLLPGPKDTKQPTAISRSIIEGMLPGTKDTERPSTMARSIVKDLLPRPKDTKQPSAISRSIIEGMLPGTKDTERPSTMARSIVKDLLPRPKDAKQPSAISKSIIEDMLPGPKETERPHTTARTITKDHLPKPKDTKQPSAMIKSIIQGMFPGPKERTSVLAKKIIEEIVAGFYEPRRPAVEATTARIIDMLKTLKRRPDLRDLFDGN